MNIWSKIIFIAALPLVLAACTTGDSFGTAPAADSASADSVNYIKRHGSEN